MEATRNAEEGLGALKRFMYQLWSMKGYYYQMLDRSFRLVGHTNTSYLALRKASQRFVHSHHSPPLDRSNPPLLSQIFRRPTPSPWTKTDGERWTNTFGERGCLVAPFEVRGCAINQSLSALALATWLMERILGDGENWQMG